MAGKTVWVVGPGYPEREGRLTDQWASENGKMVNTGGGANAYWQAVDIRMPRFVDPNPRLFPRDWISRHRTLKGEKAK